MCIWVNEKVRGGNGVAGVIYPLGKDGSVCGVSETGSSFMWVASVTILAFGKSRWTDSMIGHINLQIVLQ